MGEIKKFKRVLVANRGEIAIRVFRACRELGIRTVAIYSEEDKNSLFRTKADEAYQIGKGKTPVGAYLGINEIIELAKAKGVDAIHPGYGFLSENVQFAEACAAAGIEFIGPTGAMMDALGDKIKSKIVANSVGVPTIPGVEKAIQTEEEAVEKFKKSRVAVFGIGGVGGHLAEALVRSGIGTIDIIDNDIVSPSNINRQIIATHSAIGKNKTDL